MAWEDLDMELEGQLRDFDRRVEESRGETQARLEGIERCCKEAEETRRRAESRAQREAILRLLDRLPPPESEQ